MSLRIKSGDTVMVISGRDKGARGRVLAFYPKADRALVEGVNMIKRHTKPRGQQQGGIIEKESPIHVSNLMLVDPKTNIASRFSSPVDEKGNKARRSTANGNEI